MSDLSAFLTWWLLVGLTGWVAWPLATHFLRWLPDLGYSLSKPFGLLVGGYLFWILASFGFLTISPGGVFMVVLLLGAGSAVVLARPGHWEHLRDWLRVNWRTVLVTELVFLLAFAVWAWVRSLNPEITATEKPMEFAFLNSIIATTTQPPRDPWLAGYAISYYYFGYIIIALLTTASGVLPSTAFNLGIALAFGLTAVAAYGVVLNLIAATVSPPKRVSKAIESEQLPDLLAQTIPALLGPLLVVVTSNFNGLLEVLHYRGMLPASFWAWMDIQHTNSPPVNTPPLPADLGWIPDRYLWWWQSSRILNDKDLLGESIGINPIDEFPLFSFLLGDMHPHVLALPFVVMAVGLAFALYLGVRDGHIQGRTEWLPLPTDQLLLLVIVLGGLSFLNTWDFPIYVFVTVAAFLVARGQFTGWKNNAVWHESIALGLWLAVLGVLFYLPFYVGFRSQAGGILPNPIYSTRLNQFIVMFGPAFVLLLAWLTWTAVRNAHLLNQKAAWWGGAGILGGLVLAVALLTGGVVLATRWNSAAHSAMALVLNSTPLAEALPVILQRRLTSGLWVPLLLAAIIGLSTGLVFRNGASETAAKRDDVDSRDRVLPFVLVLVVTGALLTIGPEFVYLRDNFGLRMNTIFKFYYQAWVLWGLAAAFGSWQLLRYAQAESRILYTVLLVIVIPAGLVYTVLATYTKTEQLQGTTTMPGGERYATLDGMAYMTNSHRYPDYLAIQWINANLPADAVIAEAVGGQYTEYARISVHTGRTTVLGWPGHEGQWRGGYAEVGSREEDIQMLYASRTWTEAQQVLEQYDIDYIYVGPTEISAYGADGLPKFDTFMDVVYSAEGVIIYRRR